MAKKPKLIEVYCVVCKTNVPVHDMRQFRENGHFEAEPDALPMPSPSNLVAPNIGRFHRRHARKLQSLVEQLREEKARRESDAQAQ